MLIFFIINLAFAQFTDEDLYYLDRGDTFERLNNDTSEPPYYFRLGS